MILKFEIKYHKITFFQYQNINDFLKNSKNKKRHSYLSYFDLISCCFFYVFFFKFKIKFRLTFFVRD